VELHGFLSYLVKCNLEGREYRVYGYQGKQVRDNIHSLDVARFMAAFVAAPRAGEVYNLGGGNANSCSILEAFELAGQLTGRPQVHTYVD
jgi:CDP-paratose 2-epimerase